MSREAFEKWARLRGYSCTVREKQYLDSATRMVDEAWQACAEQKVKRIAELTAQNKELVEENKKLKNFYAQSRVRRGQLIDELNKVDCEIGNMCHECQLKTRKALAKVKGQ